MLRALKNQLLILLFFSFIECPDSQVPHALSLFASLSLRSGGIGQGPDLFFFFFLVFSSEKYKKD